MTTAEPTQRCAVITRAIPEPLAGTAPTVPRWLCLEHPEPWPRDIARHPEPAIRALLERASTAGFRPLLVRQPTAAADPTTRRVYLTDADPARAATTLHRVTGPAGLADVPLPAPGDALPGEPVPAPMLLVCTHAERDPCCGTDGRALVDALVAAGEPDVWECSHLGGHRFAATALVLPTGYLYGHLDRDAAAAVRAAAAAGEMLTDHCRGRCSWSPAGQVAELAVRAETGARAADGLVVLSDSDDTASDRTASDRTASDRAVPDDIVSVDTASDDIVLVADRTGARWTVEVTATEVDTVRPVSCGVRHTLMAPLQAGPVRPRPAAVDATAGPGRPTR